MKSLRLTLTFFTGIFLLSAWTLKTEHVALPNDDYIYDFVDEMPEFPGGEIGLEKYLIGMGNLWRLQKEE